VIRALQLENEPELEEIEERIEQYHEETRDWKKKGTEVESLHKGKFFAQNAMIIAPISFP
jgi:hypothetical protein